MIHSSRDIESVDMDTNRICDLKLCLFEFLAVRVKDRCLGKSHSNIEIGIQNMYTNKNFFDQKCLELLSSKAKDMC